MTAQLRSDPARIRHFARARLQYRAVRGVVQMLVVAGAIALGLRALAYEPCNIPSQSMLPTLLTGDYLFIAKWPYGYSRYSLPLGLPLFDGRIGGAMPARGDVVVFKTPRDNRTDFIKRVIGLPGDRIAMHNGVFVINGIVTPHRRMADFVTPAAADDDCRAAPGERFEGADGRTLCRLPRYVETIGARSYAVLDQVAHGPADEMATEVVPPGHYFMAGDNRDDSADSRLDVGHGGVGMVPAQNLVGRADRIFFSVDDGSGAIRTSRIGGAL